MTDDPRALAEKVHDAISKLNAIVENESYGDDGLKHTSSTLVFAAINSVAEARTALDELVALAESDPVERAT